MAYPPREMTPYAAHHLAREADDPILASFLDWLGASDAVPASATENCRAAAAELRAEDPAAALRRMEGALARDQMSGHGQFLAGYAQYKLGSLDDVPLARAVHRACRGFERSTPAAVEPDPAGTVLLGYPATDSRAVSSANLFRGRRAQGRIDVPGVVRDVRHRR